MRFLSPLIPDNGKRSKVTTVTLILSAVSLIAGFVDSIAGGGGLILLPAILLAGIPPQLALGTNKLGSTFGTGMALFNFVRKQKVVWKIAVAGVWFTLAGSFLGTKTILFFTNRVIGSIIIALLPLAFLGTLIPRKERACPATFSKLDLYFKIPLICLIIGFYDGFFGPGTGSFLIIAFYTLIGLNLVEATASAKVFNLTSNIGALTVFLCNQKVLFLLGVQLAIANMLGNYFGSMLAIKKGAGAVKVFLVITLSILFGSLVWKYFIHF
jgi:uncharacterized membrane protein YfcA